MSAFNLPPGVSLNDPHINPDDDGWDHLLEEAGKDCEAEAWTDIDALVAWKLGVAALRAAKKYGAKFPHD